MRKRLDDRTYARLKRAKRIWRKVLERDKRRWRAERGEK